MTILTDITYLSQEEKENKIQMFRQFAKRLTWQGLMTYMGMTNHYVWCIMTNYGVYYNNTRDIGWLNQLMSSEIEAQVCLKSMCRCIKENWPNAYNSDKHLRKCREIMRTELHLWDFEDRPKGAKNGGKENFVDTPPHMTNVDFLGLVLLFKICLEELQSRELFSERELPYSHGKTIPSIMPDHGGYLMIRVYDEINSYSASAVEWDEEVSECFVDHYEIEEDQEIDEIDFISGPYHLFLELRESLVFKPYKYAKKIFHKAKKAVYEVKKMVRREIYTKEQMQMIPY